MVTMCECDDMLCCCQSCVSSSLICVIVTRTALTSNAVCIIDAFMCTFKKILASSRLNVLHRYASHRKFMLFHIYASRQKSMQLQVDSVKDGFAIDAHSNRNFI